jgi:Spy/CpxP family protein refolding chaperone
MKLFKYLTCILFIAAIMLSAAPLIAKGAEEKPAKKKKERKKKEGGEEKKKKEEGGDKKKGKGKEGGKGGAMAQFKELKLKEGQKDKIQTILQETKDAKKDLAAKTKALQAKAKDSKDDKEAGKARRKEMSELKKQRAELDKEQDRKIVEVLDNKQKEKWNGLQAYKVLSAHLKKAKLSAEQKVQVKDICMSASDSIDGDNLKQSVEKLMKKVKADVLDENQKKLFEKKDKGDKAEGGNKKGKKKKEGAGEEKKKGKKKKKKEGGDPEK